MGIFGKDIEEKDKGSEFLSLEDDILKKKLQILGVEVIKANNPKFGANEKDGLLKKGLLVEGETFKYNFMTEEGEEKHYDTKSVAFYVGVKQAQLKGGEWIKTSRTGKMEETRYKFEVVK